MSRVPVKKAAFIVEIKARGTQGGLVKGSTLSLSSSARETPESMR